MSLILLKRRFSKILDQYNSQNRHIMRNKLMLQVDNLQYINLKVLLVR